VAATAFLNLSMGMANNDPIMIGVAAVIAGFITVIALRRLPAYFHIRAPELGLRRRGGSLLRTSATAKAFRFMTTTSRRGQR
jgi:hypothetical protein